MLLTEVYKPAIYSVRLPLDNKNREVTDETIPKPIILYTPDSEPQEETQTALSTFKIFTIKFNYLALIHHTKVMKVKYGSSNHIYKVVFFSILSPGASICWFEHLPHNWVSLLGNGMDYGLKEAITAAIENQEE
ncbi:hypothetical protein [Mucilaginibacter paludis]|nr:hypothetical protein [Mucilaginibacter paludis]